MADTRTTSSTEAELLRLRDKAGSSERAEMMRAVVDGLLDMHRKYGVLPDSMPGIREERDRRG